MSLCLFAGAFAQKDVHSIKYEGALTQYMSQKDYDLIMQYSPAKLVAIYYEATHFCYIDNKLPENTRSMGELCDAVIEGNTCDKAEEIVGTKQILPKKYLLRQDEVRYSAYSIGSTGYYVIVYPVSVYENGYKKMLKEYGL